MRSLPHASELLGSPRLKTSFSPSCTGVGARGGEIKPPTNPSRTNDALSRYTTHISKRRNHEKNPSVEPTVSSGLSTTSKTFSTSPETPIQSNPPGENISRVTVKNVKIRPTAYSNASKMDPNIHLLLFQVPSWTPSAHETKKK